MEGEEYVWRVRSGENIFEGDCDGMIGFPAFSDARLYPPLRIESKKCEQN